MYLTFWSYLYALFSSSSSFVLYLPIRPLPSETPPPERESLAASTENTSVSRRTEEEEEEDITTSRFVLLDWPAVFSCRIWRVSDDGSYIKDTANQMWLQTCSKVNLASLSMSSKSESLETKIHSNLSKSERGQVGWQAVYPGYLRVCCFCLCCSCFFWGWGLWGGGRNCDGWRCGCCEREIVGGDAVEASPRLFFCCRRRFDGVVKKGLVFSWRVSKVAGTKKTIPHPHPDIFLAKFFIRLRIAFSRIQFRADMGKKRQWYKSFSVKRVDDK